MRLKHVVLANLRVWLIVSCGKAFNSKELFSVDIILRKMVQ